MAAQASSSAWQRVRDRGRPHGAFDAHPAVWVMRDMWGGPRATTPHEIAREYGRNDLRMLLALSFVPRLPGDVLEFRDAGRAWRLVEEWSVVRASA